MSHTTTSAAFFLLPGGLAVLGCAGAFAYMTVRARFRPRLPAPAAAVREQDTPAPVAAELEPPAWSAQVLLPPRPPRRRPAVTPTQRLALAPPWQDAGDG